MASKLSDFTTPKGKARFLYNLFTARNGMTPAEALEQILFESMTEDEQKEYLEYIGQPLKPVTRTDG